MALCGDQICNLANQCKWRHLVAKFATNQFWTILAERFTQVMDSNPWVRCTSGNVFLTESIFLNEREWTPDSVTLHTVCYFTHSVWFFIQCVILHTVCKGRLQKKNIVYYFLNFFTFGHLQKKNGILSKNSHTGGGGAPCIGERTISVIFFCWFLLIFFFVSNI